MVPVLGSVFTMTSICRSHWNRKGGVGVGGGFHHFTQRLLLHSMCKAVMQLHTFLFFCLCRRERLVIPFMLTNAVILKYQRNQKTICKRGEYVSDLNSIKILNHTSIFKFLIYVFNEEKKKETHFYHFKHEKNMNLYLNRQYTFLRVFKSETWHFFCNWPLVFWYSRNTSLLTWNFIRCAWWMLQENSKE